MVESRKKVTKKKLQGICAFWKGQSWGRPEAILLNESMLGGFGIWYTGTPWKFNIKPEHASFQTGSFPKGEYIYWCRVIPVIKSG